MLDYNEIKPRKYIVLDGEPYEVIDSLVAKKNRGKPTNQTKIKSLLSGKVTEKTFHASDKVHEADMSKRDIKYLYQKGDEVWFCMPDDPKDRFALPLAMVEDELHYIKAGDVIKGMYFEDEVISVQIPIKVTLTVTEAPPAVKGNTATGATKRVTLETGLIVEAPLFITEGERIVVNTERGDYVERSSD